MNKVLFFQPFYDLKGHFKPFLKTHERILTSSGFDCFHVIGRDSKQKIEDTSSEYYYNGSNKIIRLLSTYRGLKKIKEVCRKQNIEIIHFLDFEIIVLCFFMFLNQRFFSKKKLILTLHSVNYIQKDVTGIHNTIYRKLIIYCYRYLDSAFTVDIVTNGDTLTDTFNSQVGLKHSRVITSNWGTEEANSTVDLHQKKQDSFLFLGIIRRDKNIEYLLEQFSNIQSDYILTIAGMPFGYEKKELNKLIKYSGIPDKKLKTHLDFLDDQDYESLLSSHKYIVLPYKETNKSNSGPLIQALQYNIIPIVSDYGERAQIVNKFSLGYTFKFHHGANLSSIIQHILKDEDSQEQIYLDNIIAKKDSYLWKNILEKLIQYHKIYMN